MMNLFANKLDFIIIWFSVVLMTDSKSGYKKLDEPDPKAIEMLTRLYLVKGEVQGRSVSITCGFIV